jgi:hypothetical protein
VVEYGDEIDVIAPADILKQIFKMPYSKARLSIAVHRIGQTLVLNTGWVFVSAALFVILLILSGHVCCKVIICENCQCTCMIKVGYVFDEIPVNYNFL